MSDTSLVTIDNTVADVIRFDIGEFAAQIEETTKPKAPRRSDENLGKVNINMTKGNGKFQYCKPDEVYVKAADQTGLDTAKVLRVLIMSSNFRMLNWPAGSKRPACSSVAYSFGVDPVTKAPVTKEGDPMMPSNNKWNFIKGYNLQAVRNGTAVNPDGTESFASTPFSCVSCMNENEDEWFKKCNQTGRVEVLVTQKNGTKIAEPFIGYINVTKATAQRYHEYVDRIKNKYRISAPFQVVTDIEIEQLETKAGTPYYVLKFAEVAPTTPEQQAVISSSYGALESGKNQGNPEAAAPAEATEEAPAPKGKKGPF